MPRKKLVPVEASAENQLLNLSNLVDEYATTKDQINALDKIAKQKNTEIKSIMNDAIQEDDEGKRNYSTSQYTITLTTVDTSKMNEEKLIAYLKEHGLAEGIVKQKEYIDEKEFENAVFNGVITDEALSEMESCKEYSSMQKLTYKANKGGKK